MKCQNPPQKTKMSLWHKHTLYINISLINVSFRFDLFMHCDVAERDIRDFQETWGIPVLRTGGEVTDGLGDVASLLNCLAESLWHQDCVTAGSASHHSQETVTLL